MATSKGGYVSGGFDILKAPNAPTITSVTTGIGSASVAFTAPTDVGGGAITSYTITAVNESTGASTGAVGTASPITITPGGGTFKIRAAATNIYGPGRVSQYETGKQIYSGAELEAWGSNLWLGSPGGQLGQNNAIDRSSPVQVGALTDWKHISAGPATSASIKTNGTLWTWGNGQFGGLGHGDVISRSSPVQVGALTDWYQVSAGSLFMSAIKTNYTLWGWGRNTYGNALGGSAGVYRSSPVQVGALTDWYQVSVGGLSTAAVKSDGTLWTWGNNTGGKLGQNGSAPQSPVKVGSLTNWAQISVSGGAQMAAVKTDGTLWTWGNNSNGQLGDNTRVSKSSPVQIGALTDWYQVSAGYIHTVAIKTNGTLWAWGASSAGALGDNTIIARSSPVQVGALTNWAQVSAGNGVTVATRSDNTLWAWGYNGLGALGDGTVINRSSPVQIGALANWVQVSTASSGSGFGHTLALYGVV